MDGWRGRIAAGAATLALFLGGGATANPMMVEGAHGVQVPKTFHAQVTWFCASGFGTCSAPTEPLQRGGQALSAPWQEASVSTNTGSGVTGVTAFQVCDCDLPPATYHYVITPPAGSGGYGPGTYSLDVAIADPPPEPQGQQPMPDGDVAPWDEPDPPWPQGVDCAAWCKTATPDTPPETVPDAVPPQDVPVAPDVPVVADTTAPDVPTTDRPTADVPGSDVALPDDPINPLPDTGGKGCVAAGAGSASAGLPVAATLVMLALARLRRRNDR